MLRYILLIILSIISLASVQAKTLFNDNWRFYIAGDAQAETLRCEGVAYDDSLWERLALPHNAHNEPLCVNDQWQGVCWYRKRFDIANYSADKKYFIEFEAAMNQTMIWINGEALTECQGGYLPIVVDITSFVNAEDNVIAVRLDNRDNQVTGPKPLSTLDFNMYGGLYRNAWFIEKNSVYITDPILANREASGGIFVTYPTVAESESEIQVQTHVANDSSQHSDIVIKCSLYYDSVLVANKQSKTLNISAYGDTEYTLALTVANAKLWSPVDPNLYDLRVDICSGDQIVDSESLQIGIKEIVIEDNQLYINGVHSYLRGVNRHQEYPYIGYALSDNAQYRDAVKIKEAGFDYVRLSHYPHSPAFMRACDQLGLLVADAIMGWQYYNETQAFRQHAYQSVRDLVRRDRNHACVLAWEVSLNETDMPLSFMKELHRIAHKEYPGDNVYTCGWKPEVYDIYFQARQHRILHKEDVSFEKPYMVSEYGDWEYFSDDAGFNQDRMPPSEWGRLSSRQPRANGEVGLLRQSHNTQEAHNDNMNTPAMGDSYWVMYDYNRGYSNDLETSGVMDIYRLPKFSYYFYQSQRPYTEPMGAMVKIASHWSAESATDVKVYSNCDEVRLYLNNRIIGVQTPDSGENCQNLSHPPFTFNIDSFRAGELRAEAYIDGKIVAQDIVRTPQKPKELICWVDESNRPAEAGCGDVLFLYVAAVDRNGTICCDFNDQIDVCIDDKLTLLNTDGITTEAGVATLLVGVNDIAGNTTIKVVSGKLKGNFVFNIK